MTRRARPTPRSSALAGSPYPSVAELLEDCRAAVVQDVGRRAAAGARRGGVRRAAGRGRARDLEARAARPCSHDVIRVLGALARAPTRRCQRPGRAGDAAGADRHAGPARAARAPRASSARPGPTQLRQLPALPRRRSSTGASGSTSQVGARPAADGPDRRPAGGLPAPGRRAARGPAAGRGAARRCAGCSRSTASRCGPSSSAPPHPVSDQRIRKALGLTARRAGSTPRVDRRDRPSRATTSRPMTPGRGASSRTLAGGDRPGAGRARRPTGRPRCWCAAPATPTTPRSPTGCSTSPTPRASRPSPRCGRARPRDSLAGCLWRLYLLRSWVYADPAASPREFEAGRARAQVARVVAGVADPPGPDELKAMVDEVLRGIAGGDFADVLFRAAAFARVVATGRAATQADQPRRGRADAGAGRAARGRRARARESRHATRI